MVLPRIYHLHALCFLTRLTVYCSSSSFSWVNFEWHFTSHHPSTKSTQRAATLRGNDPLAILLFQIGSPAHIAWGDTRWQEVLHGYDVWVHVDADSNPLVNQACQSMARHAETSSNLAALSLHVTRMLREIVHDIRRPPMTVHEATTRTAATAGTGGPVVAPVGTVTTTTVPAETDQSTSMQVADFSKRISRVAKARATAGALQLLRLLCHPVIVKASHDPETSVNSLREAFVYRTRGDLPNDQPAGFPLVHSILDFVAAVGTDQSVVGTGEVYDAVVFALQLLFVLFGTQLYQPFQSSFERTSPLHYILDEVFRPEDDDETIDNNNLHSLWSSRSSISSGSYKTAAVAVSKNGRGGDRGTPKRGKRRMWTPQLVLETCLAWQLNRPEAPDRSISRYYYVLAQSVVAGKSGEKPGPDGMYESYMVVHATAPTATTAAGNDGSSGQVTTAGHTTTSPNRYSPGEDHHNIIIDATKGVLTLSGTIILLPFRLMRLIFGVFVANKKGSQGSNDAAMMKRFISGASGTSSRTRDTLWLSDSILADLGCSLILLLLNNNRNGESSNRFRSQMKELTDDRWERSDDGGGLPDLPNFNGLDSQASFKLLDFGNEEQQELHRPTTTSAVLEEHPLTLNFESLFISFGRTLHTEVGALFLYTLIQSSPTFAESLVVRSDLDTLVMPLLRTLYFASRVNTYMAKDYASTRHTQGGTSSVRAMDIRSCPFRSQSQLYVIVILLLLFSQDASFGRDAFRRISVSTVAWYKDRHLKNINLGSIMVLTLLRSLLFNLNRLHDPFLLSNCCAVLMNMSPAVVDLHEYASMRLAAVTVTVMKKHFKLATSAPSKQSNGDATTSSDRNGLNGHDVVDGNADESTPQAMHGEVARTLLGVIKNCLSPQNVEQNLELIYALVYHQVDLMKLSKASIVRPSGGTRLLYSTKLTQRMQSVILEASALIQQAGARSAPKALKVLETHMSSLKAASINGESRTAHRSPSKRRQHKQNDGEDAGNGNVIGSLEEQPPSEEEYTFTYEEEGDPEIFFLPYVWEVIVCVVTSGTMDWKKDEIRAFALLDEVEIDNDDDGDGDEDDDAAGRISAIDMALGTGVYTTDADDRV